MFFVKLCNINNKKKYTMLFCLSTDFHDKQIIFKNSDCFLICDYLNYYMFLRDKNDLKSVIFFNINYF